MSKDFNPANVHSVVKGQLDDSLAELERRLGSDVITYWGPIVYGSDDRLRRAIETIGGDRQPKLTVILDTPGGVVEIVERMVEFIRCHYRELVFIVPDRAMSAGTVFVMAGDAIMMDDFSRLGPIDPQIEKDGNLVPALSYLAEYSRLMRQANEGKLSEAEFALLTRFDVAEMDQYAQARHLTVNLLCKWLTSYKFKNWETTESRGLPVDDTMREKRAHELAETLSDNEKWHSHARGISMKTLRDELNLRIDDFGKDLEVGRLIRDYYELLRDYLSREKIMLFVHTRNFF
ncbi:MAG: serine dehydrogenasease [Candidatus Nealsonbacteria bacterium]|nr:serine dehydrogenasease [Candidatus Nealsonbacteria bacterium]